MEALWAPVLKFKAADVDDPILARAKVSELKETPGTEISKVCRALDGVPVVSLYKITSAAEPVKLLNPIVVEPPDPTTLDKS